MTTSNTEITLSPRAATVRRRTRETDVEVRLGLDGSGIADVTTGVGFYDHLLGSLAHHGLFDLSVHLGELDFRERVTALHHVPFVHAQGLDHAAGLERQAHLIFRRHDAVR